MSAYDSDGRVTDFGDGTYEVLNRSQTGYIAIVPANDGFAAVPAGALISPFGLRFATADDAIRAQIGEPQ